MQSEKQKKRTGFIIGGGIVLAAFLLISIVWLMQGAKIGTGVVACLTEKAGMETSEVLHRFLSQTALATAVMLLVFLLLVYQSRKNARILLEQEKADNDRFRAAIAQIERERTAMENIQAALGSGPWSMDFNERAEIVSCIWTDMFRKMLGYKSEEDFPNRLESWSDLLQEEDKAYVMKEYWDTVRDYSGEKTYDVRYRLLTKNEGGDGSMQPAGSPEGKTVPRSLL